MKRGSDVGGGLAKARNSESRPKQRNRRRTTRRRRSSAPGGELVQLSRELNEALQQQAATSEVLRVISEFSSDLQPVFATILENAARICDTTFGDMYRWDGTAMQLAASYNTPPAYAEVLKRTPLTTHPKSFVGRLVATKQVVHVADMAAQPLYNIERYPPTVAAVELANMRSLLLVPMLKKDELLGALTIYRQEVRPFTERQIALVTSFASQAVIAIENARLVSELRQRGLELSRSVNELHALGEVSQAVNSTLDLETVLSTIVAKAVQLSGTEAGAVCVLDDAQRQFRLRATYGIDRETACAIERWHIGIHAPIVARLMAQNEPLMFADLAHEATTPLDQIIISAGIRALLVTPLLRGQAIVGILTVGRRTPGPLAHNSVNLIKTFAAQSVLAIQNARLFEHVEARTRELAKSLDALQRERSNKLMNLEAIVASIGHEVRQPLSGIALNGSAALRFLGRAPPNLEEARSALTRMVSDSHRASQVFDNIRALFGKTAHEQKPIDVNELTLGVLEVLHEESEARGVATRVELASELPAVMGHRGQLQEVLINLIRNAIEAMEAVKDDRRVLKVRSELDGSGAIAVAVEDSGPGIDPKQLSGIFDAFVTTKPDGMGLGLAICRMIVERHDGQLSASPAHPRGSVFRLLLPSGRLGA